ncbi:CGNR zinc finger domain-containing protein [Arcobacter sp. LA11]|uniref:CGNR zinc finger domain-containing protein n=1 Tax=Arcobacter sp. LA11 TaxID=1898176 RepID=UPI000932FCFD|nr:CGNR zinc finger domain-containing protein [Arcobacter sp. LA11]
MQKKYFDDIVSYRALLKKSFNEYSESENTMNDLVEKTNNILFENKVHPQVRIEDNTYILDFSIKANKYNLFLTLIAIEVAKLLNSKELQYLKKCHNHTCSLLFIDTSKNHSRRWCSMEGCGNRSKVNSFTKRQKNYQAKKNNVF